VIFLRFSYNKCLTIVPIADMPAYVGSWRTTRC